MTFDSAENFACRIDTVPWKFDAAWLASFGLFIASCVAARSAGLI